MAKTKNKNKKQGIAAKSSANSENTLNQEKQGRLSSIALMIVCTIFTSLGQLFLKFGANRLEVSLKGIFLNFPLIAGIIFYVIGAALLIYSLKKANLSFIYPFVSLSFIWVSLLSYFFLNESLSFIQLLGIPCIIIGVSLIGGGR